MQAMADVSSSCLSAMSSANFRVEEFSFALCCLLQLYIDLVSHDPVALSVG